MVGVAGSAQAPVALMHAGDSRGHLVVVLVAVGPGVQGQVVSASSLLAEE